MGSKIIGCGSYLPAKIVTNNDLEKTIDTSDEWITSRTGISQRHIAQNDQYTSHIAYEAAKSAIRDAQISLSEIDLIITCTNTPDNSFPSVANKVQGMLSLNSVPSMDLQAICSGFLYGLHTADGLIKSGKHKTILLICADKMSSLIDWEDRSTCVLFGDGAGAIILQNQESNSDILDSQIYSDGSQIDILYTDGGVSSSKTSGRIQMKGSEVFKKAVEKMSESSEYILQKNNLNIKDVDYLIPHQANSRIINSVAKKIGISKEKIIITIDKHANCSAASIPLALASLKSDRGIKENSIILFTAFGAGATWGAALVKW